MKFPAAVKKRPFDPQPLPLAWLFDKACQIYQFGSSAFGRSGLGINMGIHQQHDQSR